MLTVHEVAKRTGVSVRTLHYYDELGLLCPAKVTQAGYRLYDAAAMERLQLILFFRELEFPLKEIREILDRPGFDRKAALNDQITLLKMQRAHLDGLIALAEKEMEGENTMTKFDAFDKTELNAYAEEAKKRWGGTEAYAAYEKKTEQYGKSAFDAANAKLMDAFQAFADVRTGKPDTEEAAKAVRALQKTITDNYYPCTDEILLGLADMYVGDERFQKNIDRYGEGTAAFASAAIKACLKK